MEVHGDAPPSGLSYDDFFQANYETLRRWALQITSYDAVLSEDLLHDMYLRFSIRNAAADNVESVQGYLYTALKNSYVTHLRKKTRTASKQILFLSDEQSAHDSLTVDPRATLLVQDTLLEICEYACERKSRSIAAGILILRFFHGYFSAEVARIVNRSRNAVEARLLKARREVNQYLLDSPNPVKIATKKTLRRKEFRRADTDLLAEIRERIFSAVTGSCFSNEGLRAFYKKLRGGVEREELSHIVSCRKCLDDINDLLKMPRLAERHPLDKLGPQTTLETLQIDHVKTMAAGMACLVSIISTGCINSL